LWARKFFPDLNNQFQTSRLELPYPKQFSDYPLAVIPFYRKARNFFAYDNRHSCYLRLIGFRKKPKELPAFLMLKIENG